jgi:hypothetical protein
MIILRPYQYGVDQYHDMNWKNLYRSRSLTEILSLNLSKVLKKYDETRSQGGRCFTSEKMVRILDRGHKKENPTSLHT